MFYLLVPFYNESENLPKLIESLKNQLDQSFKVVFINNGSTDNSMQVIEQCSFIKKKQWIILTELEKGKWAALRTAVKFVRKQAPNTYLATVDADSKIEDLNWTATINKHLKKNKSIGYIYGPFSYTGFEKYPTFNYIYSIYNRILIEFMDEVGWFGTGTNAVIPSYILEELTDKVAYSSISEEDLKICLYILNKGLYPKFNSSLISSSGRNIIKTKHTLEQWAFYDPKFYSKKWSVTLDDQTLKTQDISPKQINSVFKKRALKLAIRNIVPLIIFEKKSLFLKSTNLYLDLNLKAKDFETYKKLPLKEILWDSNSYESLLSEISSKSFTKQIAYSLYKKMNNVHIKNVVRDNYEERSLSYA